MRGTYRNELLFRNGKLTRLGLSETGKKMIAWYINTIKLSESGVEKLRAHMRATKNKVIERENARRHENPGQAGTGRGLQMSDRGRGYSTVARPHYPPTRGFHFNSRGRGGYTRTTPYKYVANGPRTQDGHTER